MQPEKLQNLYAEAATLGSMILAGNVIPCVLERLTKADFMDDRHQVLFDSIVRVWRQAGRDLDGVLVRTDLDKTGQLAAAGGVEYLGKVLETVPSAANACFYRDMVAEKSKLRKLVCVVEAMQRTLDQGNDSAEVAESIRSLALGIDADQPRRSVFEAEDCAIEAALAIQDEGAGLQTGFRNIDDIVGGFQPGELIILAARPSVGKTSLALGIAGHVAKSTGVLFVTLEMPAKRIFQNLAGMWGKVDVHALRKNPDLSSVDRFQEAALEVAKTGLTVVESCSTVDRIAGAIRSHKQEAPLGLVVVDYLGLLRPVSKSRSRYEDTTEMSRSLKLLALSENVPILCLAQLNRQPEGRGDHKPRMSDLRDSGSIEQDADTVLLIHREDVTRKAQDWTSPEIDGEAEVAIAKSRNGPTGIAKLVFLEEYLLFADRSQAEEPSQRQSQKWYNKDGA